MIGQTIAHYRITGKLGAGGMGEVYRATDTKLGREVAIKVLPEAFASDADRMARFQREAQVLAALNHPNIAQIYGVEDRALVMELVEGEPLEGPLPLDAALNYAHQITDALGAAHEKGIVHRDLKPANIMITPAGTVKVLDFGLAAVTVDTPTDATQSPTLTLSPTRLGMILGTAAYMSPEQAAGKPVDKRADIWAFGVVVWEMLTGEQLFHGESVSHILAAVLKDQPDLTRAPAKTRRLLRRCLEKDPKKRLRDIGDAWELLDDDATARSLAPRAAWLWPTIAAVLLAAALGTLSFVHFRETSPIAEPVRFSIPLPDKAGFAAWIAVSPNGRKIAFTSNSQDIPRRVWIRSVDSLDVKPVIGSENTTTAFWSPDSRFLVFQSMGGLRKVEVSTGLTQKLCDATSVVLGGSWNGDGVILFGRNNNAAIMRVPSAGGTPVAVTAIDRSRQETLHSDPLFLPDGKRFLYMRRSNTAAYSGIYLGSIDTPPDKQSLKMIVGTSFSPSFSPPSRPGAPASLFFVRDGAMMVQPFNLQRGELAGEAQPVVEEIAVGLSRAYFSISRGVMAFRGGRDVSRPGIYDRSGHLISSVVLPAGATELALSPDGSKIAFSRQSEASRDVWLLDIARGVGSRFSTNPDGGWAPIWSPDGKYIVYSSFLSQSPKIYRKLSNGAGTEELLYSSTGLLYANDWSRDGRFLLYSSERPQGTRTWELWLLPDPGGPAGADRKPIPYLQTQFNTTQGKFSPDSKWVAYTSDETGLSDTYIRPFPDTNTKNGQIQISSNGAIQPRWRADGKELFFFSVDNRLTSVELSLGPEVRVGAAHALFNASPAVGSIVIYRWDLTRDAKNFITMGYGSAADQNPITVVLNWKPPFEK